jgi:hypothetical protein
MLEQTMDVTWQKFHHLSNYILPRHKIFYNMAKYSATSLNNIHVANKYTKNIP